MDTGNGVRVVNLETGREREICRLGQNVQRPPHNISISRDKRFVVVGLGIEKRIDRGYVFPPWTIRTAMHKIHTDTGKVEYILEAMSPIGAHTAFCPADDNLILFDEHTSPWHTVHRVWLVKADGTENRAVFPTTQGEGVGHEIWGASGKTIYAVRNSGRLPQGLWGVDVDGNERCVMVGPTVAHTTASPAEDRFAVDELFGDTSALWMSKKGSPQPEVLCQITDWFVTKPDGNRQATPYHPAFQRPTHGSNILR